MGIKGLSSNVIKQVWRDGSLKDLPRGTRIGVDGAGWLHKSVVANASDICLEKAGSHGHRAVFIRHLQQLLHAGMEVVVVLDGARWPLKSTTHSSRRNRRDAALEKAKEALKADDSKTADKFFKQAVGVPSEFVSWVIQHVGATVGASIVVANYEADAQLAKLRSDGAIDLVYSAAQDSDFLVYQGMGEIIYDLHNDGSFKLVDLHRDVLGKKIKEFDFTCWSETTFRVWSASCGCDYVENPVGVGAVKLYKLINSNLALDEDALVNLVASKAANASAYAVSLLAAVRSFQHHVVFEVGTNGAIKQVHLKPLPSNVALSGYKALTESESAGVYSGELDPITLGPRVVVQEVDDSNQPALEADFSRGQRPAQFSVQRLKAYLVNRGIPIPSTMSRREQIVELVETVISYPPNTWPVIDPWAVEMTGWTRPDPVTLDARDPMMEEALWQLVNDQTFPRMDNKMLAMLMPEEWKQTRARGLQAYDNGHCQVSKLSVQFGTHAGSNEPVWSFRMPVRASMRGQFWMARVCLSRSRVYLAPSSGCECENGCVACSHQVAILAVLRHAQDTASYEQFTKTVMQFSAETLASGAVHWWHWLFPMFGRRAYLRRKNQGPQPDCPDGLDSVRTTEHPFAAAAACGEHDLTQLSEMPLFAPGSPEHRDYVCRVMKRGHFDLGGATLVIRRDPEWYPVRITRWPVQSVSTQTEPVDCDVEMAPAPPPPVPAPQAPPPVPPVPTHSPVRNSPAPQSHVRTPLGSFIQSIRDLASRSRTPRPDEAEISPLLPAVDAQDEPLPLALPRRPRRRRLQV